MVSKLWALIKPLLPWLIAIALVMGVGTWIGIQVCANQMRSDVQTAQQQAAKVQRDFDAYKVVVAGENEARARQNQQQLLAQRDLAEQYRQKADQLASELLTKGNELALTQRKLKEKINELTRKDGAGWTGIGPRALCLYQQNLGYPARPDCSQYLSTTNSRDAGYSGDAGGTDSGLSAGGILSHSNEYGEWCQLLRNKLNTIRQLYGKEPQ